MTLRHDRGFDLEGRLQQREQRDLRRDLAPVDRVGARARVATDPQGGVPTFDDDEALVFAANNYLGLASDERVAAAAAEAASEVGTGAGASRLIVGDTPVHRSLERALAEEKSTERALAFSSGYAANAGTITALEPDVVFSDRLNHASIIDGVRLSGADVEVYDHCDPGALREAMASRARASGPDAGESWLVVTDSVFSMDGTIAPLERLCEVTEEYGAWLMVDDAHATAVHGGGIVGERGLADRVELQLGTLSKALGAQGGFVAGSEPLVEHLLNAARSFVFSTGLAPPAAAAAKRALELAPERRAPLRANVERLRAGLETAGYEVWGESHILPVLVRDREAALALDERLRERGVVAPAIRPPTVPEGTSRIRLAPQATHTEAEIDRAIAAFEAAGETVGLL